MILSRKTSDSYFCGLSVDLCWKRLSWRFRHFPRYLHRSDGIVAWMNFHVFLIMTSLWDSFHYCLPIHALISSFHEILLSYFYIYFLFLLKASNATFLSLTAYYFLTCFALFISVKSVTQRFQNTSVSVFSPHREFFTQVKRPRREETTQAHLAVKIKYVEP